MVQEFFYFPRGAQNSYEIHPRGEYPGTAKTLTVSTSPTLNEEYRWFM